MTLNLWWAFLAAFIGANLNASVGGGTFLTYPILLMMGNSSIVANATSTVVLWPGITASLPGFKKEIIKSKKWIKVLLYPALAGGILGSFILTHTSDGLFKWIAPLLILTGALLFQNQAKIDRFLKNIRLYKDGHRAALVFCIIFSISVYGAYFGAGIGILLLGGLSILGIRDIVQNIALKNVIAVAVNGVAVVYFALSGIVHWQVVPVMVCGAILGGFTGVRLVRFVRPHTLRSMVIGLGYSIAAILLILNLR